MYRLVEALDLDKTLVLEMKALAKAQPRTTLDTSATALARRAHPSRELNGSAEEVVAFGDWFTSTHGSADLERHFVAAAALGNRSLDPDRGLHGASRR